MAVPRDARPGAPGHSTDQAFSPRRALTCSTTPTVPRLVYQPCLQRPDPARYPSNHMTDFVWGAIAGGAAILLLAGAAGAWAYRRFVLLERRARHAERLAELGTPAGGLGHEIKNPPSTVQLNVQLLEEDLRADHAGPGQARVLSRLATVRNETGRLRDILDDFLRYAGRIELDRKPTELNG